MTRSDNGVWLALGATAVLGAAGMARRGSRAHRGRGGRFVPAWATESHLPRHWRYDSGMGGFIWRPLGGALGDPGLQYAIYGGEGPWRAYVWHEDESRGVTAQDSTQPWDALKAVRADLQARGYSYDHRTGQAKKRLTLADVPPRGAQNKKKWPWPKEKGWQRLAATGHTAKIGHYLYDGRRINVFVEKPNPTTWAVVERFQGPGPEPGSPGIHFGPIHKAKALPPRIFGGYLFPGGAARAAARLIEYMGGDVTNPPPPRETP